MSTTLTLRNVEINFASVLKPEENRLSGKKEFSLMGVIPEDHPQVSELRDVIEGELEGTFKSNWKKMKGIRNPLKSGPYQSFDDQGEVKNTYVEEGFIYFKAKTNYSEDRPRNGAPQVVDSKLQPITNQNDVYSGCIANVNITVNAYNNAGKGCAIYLNGVQVIEKGKRKDSSAPEVDQMFSTVADGFTTDTSGFEVVEEEQEEV